jgi:hypothetical protein
VRKNEEASACLTDVLSTKYLSMPPWVRRVAGVRYPFLAGCRHDHVFEQRVIFQLYRLSLRLGILGAKTLREVRSSRPGDPLGPGPGRLFVVRHEHQPLSCFAARALRSDVGCQDLSILL